MRTLSISQDLWEIVDEDFAELKNEESLSSWNQANQKEYKGKSKTIKAEVNE